MNKFLAILVFILFNSSFSNAEVVKNLTIEGNNRISDETIKLYGEIELNKEYKDKDLDNILQQLYKTEFFENVNVTVSNTLKVKVKGILL